MRWMNNHPPSTVTNHQPQPSQKFQQLVLEKKHPIQTRCHLVRWHLTPPTLRAPCAPNNPGGISESSREWLELWTRRFFGLVAFQSEEAGGVWDKNPGIGWVETYEKKSSLRIMRSENCIVWYNWPALRITGPCYRGVWMWFLQGSGISKAPIFRSHHYKQESFWAGAAAKWAVMSFKDGRIATFSPS